MTAFLNGPALHPNKLQPKIMLSRTIEDILSVTKAATRAVLYNISESNRANRLCTVQYTNLEDYAPTQRIVNIALSQLKVHSSQHNVQCCAVEYITVRNILQLVIYSQ